MKALHSASGTGIGYNPGVTYRGGEFIAQGIAQAGNAITKGIEQWQKNREERDFLDEQYKSRVAALSQFSDFEKTANEDDTSPAGRLIKSMSNWDNKSLSAKKAALMDADLLINKSEQAQRRAEDSLRWLRGEERAQQALDLQQKQLGVSQGHLGLAAWQALLGGLNQWRDDARQRERLDMEKQAQADRVLRLDAAAKAKAEQDAALAGFAGRFSALAGEDFSPTEGRGMLLPMTGEQRVRSALKAFPQAAVNPQFDNTLTALQRFAPGEDSAGRFTEDQVTGMRFYEKNKTVMPSGVNPDKAFGARPITGPDGQSLGFGMPGRGGVTPLRTGEIRNTDKYKRLVTQESKLLDGYTKALSEEERTAYRRQLNEVQAEISILESGGRAGGGAATSWTDFQNWQQSK